jgi:hypothetical protein
MWASSRNLFNRLRKRKWLDIKKKDKVRKQKEDKEKGSKPK